MRSPGGAGAGCERRNLHAGGALIAFPAFPADMIQSRVRLCGARSSGLRMRLIVSAFYTRSGSDSACECASVCACVRAAISQSIKLNHTSARRRTLYGFFALCALCSVRTSDRIPSESVVAMVAVGLGAAQTKLKCHSSAPSSAPTSALRREPVRAELGRRARVFGRRNPRRALRSTSRANIGGRQTRLQWRPAGR